MDHPVIQWMQYSESLQKLQRLTGMGGEQRAVRFYFEASDIRYDDIPLRKNAGPYRLCIIDLHCSETPLEDDVNQDTAKMLLEIEPKKFYFILRFWSNQSYHNNVKLYDKIPFHKGTNESIRQLSHDSPTIEKIIALLKTAADIQESVIKEK